MMSQILLLGFLAPMAAALLSSSSSETKTYIVHMDATKMSALESSLSGGKRWHEAVWDSMIKLSSEEEEGEAAPSPQLLYVYNTVLSGFAAKLSAKQASSLEKINGFLYSFPDDILLNLHTTHSPQFLGLNPGEGLWAPSNMALDVIVGVVDSGIWPEHNSFQDTNFAEIPKRWKGACEVGKEFTSDNCNKKLVGARAFWKGYEARTKINETREYKSARDSEGHGTHTASTAAGNVVAGANLFGYANGSATGMRYTARVAAYKACWLGGCANSDIIAAVDRAVSDGVDVVSLSLGGGATAYYSDPVAIATFGAIQKGVFVSCSGGNSGPSEFTISNTAPWITTVAASYLDRSFPTLVKLGNGRNFTGASLFPGKQTKQLPIIYAGKAGGNSTSAKYCDDSLSANLVKGKIVLCEPGFIGRLKKGEQVKLKGGSGMLLMNSEEEGEELFADPHVLPASSLGFKASSAVKNYVLSSKKPTAMIKFLGTVYGEPAPKMTAFSSRGPSSITPDILKPDVTAPGMSILAAWPPSLSPTGLPTDKRLVPFNIISGTSMSCPHVSGLAALLRSMHPDWSPAAIKSALMTTGYTTDNRNSTIIDVSSGSPATPFAFGSGHVNPERASNPGLIYDIAPNDYLEYLCSLNYTSKQVSAFARRTYHCIKKRIRPASALNYPSFSVLFSSNDRRNAAVTHTRTVTNVGAARCRYTVEVHQPEKVDVIVKPKVLHFTKVGQKLSYKVSLVDHGGSGHSFGDLVWKCGEFSVRSPIAVTWQQ
ncbi:hypothetical protein J5N97_021693 [Dioscorea zingiberensis]|uniref:Subtilisin-like protease SBT1.1 n=1 Tax=Dioscorea zingiberensis TaxID=325984 RepID=A0A9D5C8U3_9LILI|nr:hypothetical protein J5N97_021693 [Dioscorea zingiberensis]